MVSCARRRIMMSYLAEAARLEKPIVDYAVPSNRKSGSRVADVMITVCLTWAAIAGIATFVQTQHRPLTQARIQYDVARVQAQATRPSYVPPPFTGKTFEHVSPWGFGSMYAAIALGLLGLSLLVIRIRRPDVARQPEGVNRE